MATRKQYVPPSIVGTLRNDGPDVLTVPFARAPFEGRLEPTRRALFHGGCALVWTEPHDPYEFVRR
jgi:hypothetical protein